MVQINNQWLIASYLSIAASVAPLPYAIQSTPIPDPSGNSLAHFAPLGVFLSFSICISEEVKSLRGVFSEGG